MKRRHLKAVYVLPSKYDDEGYVLRFWRGLVPSNTLLCLKTLTEAVGEAKELGPDVDVSVEIYDDTVQRIPGASYENLAIWYVAQRRRFNAFRAEITQQIREGRIFTLDVSLAARFVLFELLVGLRFSLTFLSAKA